MSLKALAKSVIPEKILQVLVRAKKRLTYRMNLKRAYMSDMKRYLKYAHTMAKDEKIDDLETIEARLFIEFHSLEKGLSLPNTRAGFGKQKVKKLIGLLQRYKERGFPQNRAAYLGAVGALREYVAFSEDKGIEVGEFREFVKDLLNDSTGDSQGGTLQITREEMFNSMNSSFDVLSAKRHSIRDFSDVPVDEDLLMKAVSMATRSPSVCNRQTVRAYIVHERSKVREALVIQGGARGFEDAPDKLLIVSSNMKYFRDVRERNQAFFETGMFAMSLLLALQHLGVGACTLSWSKDSNVDKKFRTLFGLPESEVIGVLIAVGNFKDATKVPFSIRRPLDEVVKKT